MHVPDAGDRLGQCGELVEVRGKKAKSLDLSRNVPV